MRSFFCCLELRQPDGLGAGAKAFKLCFIQWNGQDIDDALCADYGRETQADAGNAVLPGQKRRNGQDGVLIAQNGFDDSSDGQSDGIVGGAFQTDDGIGGAAHFLLDFRSGFPVQTALTVSAARAVFGQIHAGNVRYAPGGKFAVAVFAQNKGVNIPGINAGVIAQQIF